MSICRFIWRCLFDLEMPEAPKHQSAKAHGALEDTLALGIIEILKDNPAISQDEIAKALTTTRRIVQRIMNNLKSSGHIERVGGKRYGHWNVSEQRTWKT